MVRPLPLTLLGVLFAALGLSAAPAPKPGAADWPQFRGPNRDGLSADTGLLKEWPKGGPALAWKCKGVGTGFSSVSVVGDKVFTMGDLGDGSYVFAIDRDKGEIVWKTAVGKKGGNYEGTRCTPTYDDGKLYALGQFGDLVCVEAATGKEVWRKNFKNDFGGQSGGWNFTESPLIDGDKLVCTPGGKDATMVALNKTSGDVIWKCGFNETAGYSSVVVADICGVRQYVQLLSQGVAGVSAKDGKLLWRYGKDRDHFAGNTANIPTPIVVGDQVFQAVGYSGRGGGLFTVKKDGDGFQTEQVYHDGSLKNKHGGVLRIGDHLYGDLDDSGVPWCAEWKTGNIAWSRKRGDKANCPGSGSASMTYADGHLYVRYNNGWVALVEASPTAYVEKGSFKIENSDRYSWSHPVVIGGRLYLREKDTLWVYDVKGK